MLEILRGSLPHVSLASLLQLVEAESVTGWVHIEPAGRVGFLRGSPVSAELRALTGTAALLDLFAEPATGFFVVLDETVAGKPFGEMLPLVLEGCRIADDWNRVAPLLLTPVSPAELKRDGALGQVLDKLDGRRTIGEAVAAVGVGRCDVVDALLSLYETGALHELTSPLAPERVQAPIPNDYFEAVDLGRTQMRAGEYADAVLTFERALVLRPGDRVAAQNLRRAQDLEKGAGREDRFWSSRRNA